MTLHHLAYLQQVSELIEDKHKPLAARFGFIAKKISSKHMIHIRGFDPPKLRRCKACQAPITCDNIKSKDHSLRVGCSLCGYKRKLSVSSVKPHHQSVNPSQSKPKPEPQALPSDHQS